MADLQPVILPPSTPTIVVLVSDTTDTVVLSGTDSTPVILPAGGSTVFISDADPPSVSETPVILAPSNPSVVVVTSEITDTVVVSIPDTTPVILPPVEATVFVTEVAGSQGRPGESPEAFYDIMVSVATLPDGDSQLVGVLPVRPFHYPEDLTGSRFLATTVSTADATFSIKKNGVEVGTFTFLAGQTTAVVSFPDEVSFTSTDKLQVFPPDPRDASLAVDFALAGYRT